MSFHADIFHPDPKRAQQTAAAEARELLKPQYRALVIDTETTGLEGEVWELAAVSAASGLPELLWVGCPGDKWSEYALTMHAERLDTIRRAPAVQSFRDIALDVLSRHSIVAYHAAFDQQRLEHTFGKVLTPLLCAAQLYAPFAGEWSQRRSTWRTPSLKDACAAEQIPLDQHHTALADAQATAALLRAIAEK